MASGSKNLVDGLKVASGSKNPVDGLQVASGSKNLDKILMGITFSFFMGT